MSPDWAQYGPGRQLLAEERDTSLVEIDHVDAATVILNPAVGHNHECYFPADDFPGSGVFGLNSCIWTENDNDFVNEMALSIAKTKQVKAVPLGWKGPSSAKSRTNSVIMMPIVAAAHCHASNHGK